MGRHDEAGQLFERLLSLRNDVGLLARNTTRARAAWWAIFRRPFRISRWSTPRATSAIPKPAEQRSERRVDGNPPCGRPGVKSIDRRAAPGRVRATAAHGRPSQGEALVFIDHRTYKLLPGRVPAQLELYSKLAYPVQLRYMGEPHYYMVSETGQLNTLVHGWVYESAGDREQKRAKMMQDPDWNISCRRMRRPAT